MVVTVATIEPYLAQVFLFFLLNQVAGASIMALTFQILAPSYFMSVQQAETLLITLIMSGQTSHLTEYSATAPVRKFEVRVFNVMFYLDVVAYNLPLEALNFLSSKLTATCELKIQISWLATRGVAPKTLVAVSLQFYLVKQAFEQAPGSKTAVKCFQRRLLSTTVELMNERQA